MKSEVDNNLFKNIIKLLSGAGVGSAVGFLAAPVITRLYTPADFGLLALFSSICVLCYPFCTLKYSLAIPLHTDERISINSVAACLLVLCVNTVILGFILCFFHSSVLSFFDALRLDVFWYYIPVAFFLYGVSEILSYYSIRYRRFSTIATVSVVQKIVGVLTKISMGLFRFGVTGLLLGNILAESGGLSLYIRTYWKRFKVGIAYVKLSKICFVLKRYTDFPRYRIPSQILLNTAGSLPILYFTWHFGTGATGQLSLALSILSLPVTIGCTCVGRAFYGEIAALGKEKRKEIFSLTLRIMIKLLAIIIVPFLLILCFGSWLFLNFFGPEWTLSGVFARYMSLYLIFRFVYSPVSDGIFNVFECQEILFWLEVSRLTIVVMSLLVAFLYGFSVIDTIIIYSLALMVQYLLSIILVFYILKKMI